MSKWFQYAKFDAVALASAFGRGFKTVRKQKGIRQADVHHATGISAQVITNIDNGRQNPSLVTAIIMARALDSTIDELLRIGLEAKK